MFKEILLPVDLNADISWKTALPIAVALCRSFGARLHIMTVLPDFSSAMVAQYFPDDFEEKALEEASKGLHALTESEAPEGLEVQHIVVDGTIYREVLAIAEKIDADLIVMHSHRPELKDYLLGPNAERVARHADCSVMIIRDE